MQNSMLNEVNLPKRHLQVGKIKTLNNLSIIFLSSIIATLNVLYFTNYTISMITIFFEIVILAYHFVKKNITNYLGCYLMFLCLSFEFGSFVGVDQFYGFKNFRIFGVNLGIITLIPILFLTFFKRSSAKRIRNEYPKVFKLSLIIIFMNITGFIFGIIQILINDNNIQRIDGFFAGFIGVSYNMIAIPFLIILTIVYILRWEKERLPQLQKYLVAILIGVVVSMIVSLFSGNFGYYGGVKTLLVSNILIYVPFMIVFPFYKKHKSELIVLFVGLIGTLLSMRYNASGKIIILYILIPVVIYHILLKRKDILPIIIALFLLPIIVLICIQSINSFSDSSVLFSSKLGETFSLFKFWDQSWLLNMPLSPRTRIIEFMDTFNEYLYKPWFFLFGKGYMGSFTDHTGMLQAAYVPGAYSTDQWINGTFYMPHETLNVLFLYHGLFGVVFYLYMINFVIRNLYKNPWILIGGFWFLMFYGYSVTISAFGITALLLGYIVLENYKVENS